MRKPIAILKITIDLARVAANLSAKSLDRGWTAADAGQWLAESGFRRESDGWVCTETTLKMLDADEYAILERIGLVAA